VTKVDICPAHVLEHTLATLSAILRKPGVRLKPFMVRAAPALPPACVMGTCLLHCSGCTAGKGAVMAHARAQVRSRDDVLTCARHMHTATLAPVLLTSAVRGDGRRPGPGPPVLQPAAAAAALGGAGALPPCAHGIAGALTADAGSRWALWSRPGVVARIWAKHLGRGAAAGTRADDVHH